MGEEGITMSNESKDIKAEPAFPVTFRHERIDGSVTMQEWEGMRLQEYAAIHLKVPESGTPWLDEMIQKARRDEFAKAAMNGIISNHQLMYNIDMASKKHTVDTALIVSETALSLADALIKAADEGIGEK